MAGKLSHLGYKRTRAADGYRWYRDGVRVSLATVERATRAVEAATRRAEATRAPAQREPVRGRKPTGAESRGVRPPATKPAARIRHREPAPAPPARPLADVGISEAARLHQYALDLWAQAGDAAGAKRTALIARARSVEASERRALDGAQIADARGVTLDSPIHLRDSVVKWRDAAGRFAKGPTRGGHKEVFFTTGRGQLGGGIKRLIDALLQFERADMTWDQAGDGYYKRAVALALV